MTNNYKRCIVIDIFVKTVFMNAVFLFIEFCYELGPWVYLNSYFTHKYILSHSLLFFSLTNELK